MQDNDGEPIGKVLGNGSWFRGIPHYWAEASLPLAYAVACVEVVCENSEKAGIIYDYSDLSIKATPEGADIKGYLRPEVIEDDSYVLTTERTSG
jgi:hypothetical protein